MLWIKEVEMVDSVDDLKSSHSIQGYAYFPNFDILDARIAFALKKIIQNFYFKKKVSLEEQKAQHEDRFLRGYMIYDFFRVTSAHDTVLDHADPFTITLRNDDFQEFDTMWDEIPLSMSKFPVDDVLQSLDKLRIRDPDQIKTVLELYDLKMHQKISKPDYQRFKKMVKRSIDQKLRSGNFDARNERIETGAVIRNRKDQPGECNRWKAKGQCSRGDN